jgi:hypothetical protein
MRKNVLLIDDDPDEAELFRDLLEDINPAILPVFNKQA